MRLLIILISTFTALTCFNQERLKGYVGLTQQSLTDFSYVETQIETGLSILFKKGLLTFFGTYHYYGNLTIQGDDDEYISKYKFTSHLIGGGIKYRVNKSSRFYSPVFGFSIMTEVASNYSGKRLGISNYSENGEFIFRPSDRIGEIYDYNWNGTTPQYYNTYIYLSTPLIANLFFENSFKIKNGLFVNIGIGLSLARRSVHYKQWYFNEEEPATIIGELDASEYSHGEIKNLKNLNLSFGIQYIFSFKSKQDLP